MNKQIVFVSALAVLGLTACEKGVDIGEDEMSTDFGQVKNSLLQVRTRSGGSDDDVTVSYPLQVYVFAGDECKAAQTIGDEGQTLNIALVEGSYSIYAIGGASSSDYVLPSADDALATSAITLREGHEHSDLMAAQARRILFIRSSSDGFCIAMAILYLFCIFISSIGLMSRAASTMRAKSGETERFPFSISFNWV